MKQFCFFRFILIAAVILGTERLYAQMLYEGPAAGSISGGVVVSTSSLESVSIGIPQPRMVKNKFPYKPDRNLFGESLPANGSITYSEDTAPANITDTATTFIVKSFAGIGQTNSIPPDPHLAVGPNHVIATVNSDFAIFEKGGRKLFSISAGSWYQSVFTAASPFDPKVIYDHYAKRWFMVWLDQNDVQKVGYFLISISDDDNPMGVWHNYVMPSHTNGNTFDNTWSDYQGVGYDDKAYYITGDQFSFDGYFSYTKIRIVPKAQLLGATPGAVSWTDFWNIRDPQNLNSAVFNIRPSIGLSTGAGYYLCHSPYYNANYVIVYKITGATENPVLTASRVTLNSFSYPPTPRQAGANTIPLEGSSCGLNNEPVFYNGTLWGVHTTANPLSPNYSAIHYFGINTNTLQSSKEGFFGQNGYFYLYPSIMVDKHSNIMLTYSRSGDDDYLGAYIASSKAGSNAVRGSYLVKPGVASYNKDFGSGRNRWGDYMGIALDPADSATVWTLTEFVSSKDVWDTWIAASRNIPFNGAAATVLNSPAVFKDTELGSQSDVVPVTVSNFGSQAIVIDSIAYNREIFTIISSPVFPVTLHSMDTVTLQMQFIPRAAGKVLDTLRYYSGGVVSAAAALSAKGFYITAAPASNPYIVSNGKLYTINKQTGTAVLLGESGYTDLVDIAIHPKTGIMYGLVKVLPSGTDIVRINAAAGDAYPLWRLENISAVTCAFDSNGVLFIATRAGGIYYMNMANGQSLQLTTAKCSLSTMVFHPKTNELWAAVYKPIGTGRDRIVKVNNSTGDTTSIGQTGFGAVTTGLFFDEFGTFYGSKSSSSGTDFFIISTANAQSSLIGTLPFTLAGGMEYLNDKALGTEVLPEFSADSWILASSYPNPFNPSTVITVTTAFSAEVQVAVYSLLGEKVAVLYAGELKKGIYNFHWTPAGTSSGIYFYECTARSSAGSKRIIGKMMYVR